MLETEPRIVVVHVPGNEVRRVWPTVAPWIENIAERSNGLWSGPTLLHSIEAGLRYLFMVWDREAKEAQAVCIANTTCSDLGVRSLELVAAAGHDRLDWQDALLDMATAFGSELGCKRLTAISRPGWTRALRHRMRVTHHYLEAEIPTDEAPLVRYGALPPVADQAEEVA